jgi:hypothetical protein
VETKKKHAKHFSFSYVTLGLWLDWIKDESSIAVSQDDKKRVLELYEKATGDYLCMSAWLRRIWIPKWLFIGCATQKETDFYAVYDPFCTLKQQQWSSGSRTWIT